PVWKTSRQGKRRHGYRHWKIGSRCLWIPVAHGFPSPWMMGLDHDGLVMTQAQRGGTEGLGAQAGKANGARPAAATCR
ncbi:hypothetical protein ACMYMB_23260, partial [Salmonella enterica subsp. enterica serovar Enteritidis]|uniref:hypothetical protein n=1 Tax=Salmonella enterica TaxID=28901 RepID=UPI0039ED19D3